MTQKDLIFSFLLKNPNARPIEISKSLKIPGPSTRRAIFNLRKEKILSRPVRSGKNQGTVKIRKTREARRFKELLKKLKPKRKPKEEVEEKVEEVEEEIIYRKILKIGASCGKKFRKIYAVTYEFNDENRESKLLSAIEEKYPNCIAINYNYRDLTDYKGKFVKKGDDIEDYGYAYEEWEDSVRINQFFPNIEVDEEK